jgi:hypothetical protein
MNALAHCHLLLERLLGPDGDVGVAAGAFVEPPDEHLDRLDPLLAEPPRVEHRGTGREVRVREKCLHAGLVPAGARN